MIQKSEVGVSLGIFLSKPIFSGFAQSYKHYALWYVHALFVLCSTLDNDNIEVTK